MEKNQSFPERVWKKLSSIDVTEHTTLKGKFPALPWPWAWATLMEHYPESTFEMLPPGWVENGTSEVTIEITVREGDEAMVRRMWLPVMDGRNNSIIDPTTRDISDSKMRVLTKCLGLFGLGIQLYAKSDMPLTEDVSPITTEQIATLEELLKKSKRPVARFLKWAGAETVKDVPAHKYTKAVKMLEADLAKKKLQ